MAECGGDGTFDNGLNGARLLCTLILLAQLFEIRHNFEAMEGTASGCGELKCTRNMRRLHSVYIF